MKIRNTLIALVAGFALTAGVAFASDAKAEASKVANCCAKAAKDHKACDHPCCVAAAKEGKNCEKCGGSGKIEAQKAESKK
jgi:6-phosphofructokinase